MNQSITGKNLRLIVSAAIWLFFISSARSAGLADWLTSKAVMTDTNRATASKSTPKQAQSISLDHGSTSLVDQSNGSDLVSSAFNLLPVASGGAGGQSGSGTVTASLYALYALATKQDPLTPTIYNDRSSVMMRKLFFTIGREQQNTAAPTSTIPTQPITSTSSTSTSSPPTSTTPAGTIYGVQWTPWNRRDATGIATNNKIMGRLATIATSQAVASAQAVKQLSLLMCEADQDRTSCENRLNTATIADLDAKIKGLSHEDQAGVDKIVSDYRALLGDTGDQIKGLVQELKQRSQVAINFQTTQRSAASPDDYRSELIFDKGLGSDWLLTFNGSYDYSNSSKIGGDFRSERGAFQLSRNIIQAQGAHLRTPLQFNLSAEGLRQEHNWHYRAQLQLVVPVSTGVDFPISFGYADQIDVLRQQEKGVYGKFGLTFDFGKIVDSIRGLK